MTDDDRKRLEEKARADYRAAISGIEPEDSARLAAARRKAMLDGKPAGPVRWMLPAGAAAAIAAGLIIGLPDSDPGYPELVATDAVEDMELLLADESLEMIEDLDFYLWLDVEPDAT
jgi:hypothetical protein